MRCLTASRPRPNPLRLNNMPPATADHSPALAVGAAPSVAQAAGGVSLAWVEGMDCASQWINGQYVVADDWELLA